MYGFHGRILNIDLTIERAEAEPISDAMLHRFLGGRGLGSFLLFSKQPEGLDPLEPESIIIFATGAASDSPAPGSSRYAVFAKSPLTGAYAEAYAGGSVAPSLKRTGYDAIVIRGRARTPTYLEISDDRVTFHDASSLWGKDCYQTEYEVLRQVGVPGAKAVVIGPAGENLVRFACLQNNYWRSAGRTGLGAIMGSKLLKAVVFHGHTRAPLADEAGLKNYITEFRFRNKNHPSTLAYHSLGTPMMVAILNKARAFPTRYWSSGYFEGWERISADYLLNNFKVKPKACPKCFLACGKLTRVEAGPRRGLIVEGPEYETIYAFGGLCCVDRLDDIIYLNDLCDRLGMDTISAGNLCAFAIEAVRRGKLKLDIDYGDSVGIANLLEQIASRRGEIGSLLADGIKRASKELGLEEIAVHVKGLEPAGYDPRVLKGMGLGYAVAPRGACHLRATFYKPELSGLVDPKTVEGKAELFIDYEDRMTIFDTLILCRFFRDFFSWEELARLHHYLTGEEFTTDELRKRAMEIANLIRLFNLREGFGPKDDTLPERFFAEPFGEDSLTKDELEFMVRDYYRLRGWDEQGRPPEVALGASERGDGNGW